MELNGLNTCTSRETCYNKYAKYSRHLNRSLPHSMTTTIRQTTRPLYQQLEQEILRQIRHDELKPGDKLPSESELSRRFNVSRITARRAINNLIQQGYVYSLQGKGTFVAQTRIRELSGFRSFSEDIRARGMTPSSRLLQIRRIQPKASLRAELNLPAGIAVYRLERIRLVNDEPVAYEDAYLPASLCPGLEQFDFEKRSLFDVLRSEFNLNPTWADAELEAAAADETLAARLAIRPGEPVLIALRHTYTETMTVIEFVRSVYSGKNFTFYTGRQYIG
uniref:GntR family transcriptional regulator n=1 Tax=Bellilinea caldifistulae TaxID=360411 RepID=A0A7C4Q0Q2_9CHLR